MDVIFKILMMMMMMMKGNGSLSATPRLTLPPCLSPMLSDQVVYQHAGWDCLSSYLTKDTDVLNKDVFTGGGLQGAYWQLIPKYYIQKLVTLIFKYRILATSSQHVNSLVTLYKMVTEYANYRVTAFLASFSSYLLNAIYTKDVNIIFWLKRTHLTQRLAVRWWRTCTSFLCFCNGIPPFTLQSCMSKW